jgi:hypothetical protein
MFAGNSDGGSIVSYKNFMVPKRAAPTVVLYNPSAANANFSNGGTPLNLLLDATGMGYYTTTITGSRASLHWAASSEL